MVVILQFKIEWGAIFSPDATKTNRAFNRILKGVNQAMAEYWHEKILPRHFAKGAQRRYGYKERSKKYLMRKARMFGRPPDDWRAMRDYPLQFTGTLKDRVSRYAQVKARSTAFSVLMHGPYYATSGGGRGGMPNMEEEITTLLVSEQEELRQHAQKMLPSIVARESRRVQKKTVFYKG